MSSICDCNSSLVLDFHFPSVRTKLSEQVRRFPRAPPAWFNVPTKEYVGHGTHVCSWNLAVFHLLHRPFVPPPLWFQKLVCPIPASCSTFSLLLVPGTVEPWMERQDSNKNGTARQPVAMCHPKPVCSILVPSRLPVSISFLLLFFPFFVPRRKKMERTTAGVFPVATLFHL